MIFQLIQYSIVSLALIAIVHYLIGHLIENLTTPQVRDIVTSTNEHYEAIIRRLEDGRKQGTPTKSTSDTKDDLKRYLNSLNINSSSGGNSENSGPSMRSVNINTTPGEGSLMTYDSSESVFGDYDGDAYTSY